MLGLVAEAAGHAAAARLYGFHRQPRHHRQQFVHGRHCIECFLVAVAMEQHALLHLPELQPAGLAREELLQQERVLRQRFCSLYQHREFIAQRKQARGLQSDHRYAARERRAEHIEHALRFAPRLIDHADREESASATQTCGDLHAVARRFKHRLRGARILGLEIPAEGVDEQHHVPIVDTRVAEIVAAPARQRARREAERPLQHARSGIRERRESSSQCCIARQISHSAVACAEAVLAVVLREELDLHTRHVDAGRAFALAALARHAKIEGFLHRLVAFGAELSGKREAQGVGAPAGEMDLVVRRAV